MSFAYLLRTRRNVSSARLKKWAEEGEAKMVA